MDTKAAMLGVVLGAVSAGATMKLVETRAEPGDKVVVLKGSETRVNEVRFWRLPDGTIDAEIAATVPLSDGTGQADLQRVKLEETEAVVMLKMMDGPLLTAFRTPRGLEP